MDPVQSATHAPPSVVSLSNVTMRRHAASSLRELVQLTYLQTEFHGLIQPIPQMISTFNSGDITTKC